MSIYTHPPDSPLPPMSAYQSTFNNLPGISNLLYAPPALLDNIKSFYQAYRIGDREGMLENSLRTLTTPLAFFDASLRAGIQSIQVGTALNVISRSTLETHLPRIEHKLVILGVILSTLELFLESFALVKQALFMKNMSFRELRTLQKIDHLQDPLQKRLQLMQFLYRHGLNASEIAYFSGSHEDLDAACKQTLRSLKQTACIQALEKLQQKYLELNAHELAAIDHYLATHFGSLSTEELAQRKESIIQQQLFCKKQELIHRVCPRVASEITDQLPQLLTQLRNSTDCRTHAIARHRTYQLLNEIETQSLKQIIVHVTGWASAAFILLGLLTSGPFLPLILGLVGGALAVARYYLHVGLLDSKGWSFEVQKCVPAFIYNKFWKPEEIPPSFQRYYLCFSTLR